MNKRGTLDKTIALILVFSLVISWYTPVATAASMTDLRVGLTKFYKDKATLKIKTTKIALGYSVNDSYVSDEVFNSPIGFSFQPAMGYFYIMNQTFKTYGDAMKSVKIIRSLGVEAYPVSIYRSYWKVYVGNTTTTEALEQAMTILDSLNGFTFTGPSRDNGHRVLVSGENSSFLYDGKEKNAYPQFKATIVNSSKVAVLDLGARQYRGRIEIGRYLKQSLTAVNIVNVESYLYGVVPGEMVSSWPAQALRAQAVAARSFIISKTDYGSDSNITNGYTVEDSTNYQVYKGYSMETAATNASVDATKGEVVTYNGKVVAAFYSSTSGGRTEDIADVWGVKASYLASVVDEYETEPEKDPWVIAMPKTEVELRLKQAGYNVGVVKKVIAEIATVSGRVYSLKVIGSDKSQVIQSEEIRQVFDLYSTKFKIVSDQEEPNQVSVLSDRGKKTVSLNDCSVINGDHKVTKLSDTDNRIYIVKSSDNLTPFIKDTPTSPDVYFFVGLGYGHGVGMSQSGAKGLAKQGYSYREIIQYYYKGCYVKKV